MTPRGLGDELGGFEVLEREDVSRKRLLLNLSGTYFCLISVSAHLVAHLDL